MPIGSPFEFMPSDGGDTTGFNQFTWVPAPSIAEAMDTPPPPREVKLKLLSFSEGLWRLTWRDSGPFHSESVLFSHVKAWRVSTTKISAVPGNSSLLSWSTDVRDKGTTIASFESPGTGKIMTYTHSGGPAEDIYVQVYGVSETGKMGRPSQPLRLIFSTNDTTVPAETQSQALGYALRYGSGVYYIELDAQYSPPAIRTNFQGVELHIGNWSATTLIEAGSEGTWDGAARLQDFTVNLPEDSGQGSGVAHYINGSKAVAKVSGSNFAAGWASRLMAVRNGGNGTLTRIDTVTPTTSLQLLSNWSGSTGDYPYVTYNQMSIYFVPIGPSGVRRSDPTASAVIVI